MTCVKFLLSLALACLLVGVALAQDPAPEGSKDFKATFFRRSNIPQKAPGTVLRSRSFEYDYQKGQIKVEYDFLNPAQTEYLDYNKDTHYKVCAADKCDGYLLLKTMPQLFTGGNSQVTGPAAAYVSKAADSGVNGGFFSGAGRPCTPHKFADDKATAAAGGVKSFALFGKYVCWAEFTNGERWEFDYPANPAATSSPPKASGNLAAPKKKECPTKPKCAGTLDLVFVIDESGSINAREWEQQKTFVKSVIDQFIVSPTQVNVGVVYFSGRTFVLGEDLQTCCGIADPVLPLSGDKLAVDRVIDTRVRRGGHTCIGCGIRAGTPYYPNPNRNLVPEPKRVMIVLTDGRNNRELFFMDNDLARAKVGNNIEIFAVGVRGFDQGQLEEIASEPNDQHVFTVKDYDNVAQLLQPLVNGICKTTPDDDECGRLCRGACGCGQTCICPDQCDTADKCKEAACVNNACATAVTKQCPVLADKCQQSKCNPANGNCEATAIDCVAANPCQVAACKPDVGCVVTPKKCLAPDQCGEARCDPANGQCVVTPKQCPAPQDPCKEARCDPQAGCTEVTKTCDDGKVCTTDACDAATGNCINTERVCPETQGKCFSYKCTEGTNACTATPKTCSDGNICTKDTCDPATGQCKNEPDPTVAACEACVALPCACDDSNPCTVDTFDPKTGCQHTPKTCDDSSVCTTDTCDQATGQCVFTPKNDCPQTTDKCRTTKCDPVHGCQNLPKACPDDSNWCTTEECDPATGECRSNPVVCDDGNKCTDDRCDPALRNCVHTPTICDQGDRVNICQPQKCNPATGACELGPRVTCDDGDACTDDVCVDFVGCQHLPKICSDNDPCTKNRCDPNTGLCTNEVIVAPGPECDKCKLDCPNTNPCKPTECVPGPGQGKYQCTVPQDFEADCKTASDKNKCQPSSTVIEAGQCTCKPDTTKTVVCQVAPDAKCAPNVCEPTTGLCTKPVPVNCEDGNSCFKTECQMQGAEPKCVSSEPFNCQPDQAQNPCKKVTCDGSGPTPKCVDGQDLLSCDDQNACTQQQCVRDATTGNAKCAFTAITCPDDGDKCAPKVCQPTGPDAGKCTAGPAVTCPPLADDLCRENKCDPATGTCVATPKVVCNDGICKLGKCDPATGTCTNTENDVKCPAKPEACVDAGVCKPDLEGKPQCEYNGCETTNPCQVKKCDAATTTCITSPIVCDDGDACTKDICNVVDGKAVCDVDKANPPIVCPDDSNPCTAQKCVADGGVPTCVQQPVTALCDDKNACTNDLCVADASNAEGYTCQNTPTADAANCNPTVDGNACLKRECDPATGQCVTKDAVVCDDSNMCSIDECDPATGQCKHTANPCNEVKTGCLNATCDAPTQQCVNFAVDCSANATLVAALPSECFILACTNSTNFTCAAVALPFTTNACGKCGDPNACAISDKSGAAAGAVGGVIAGAVLAGAAAVGLGAFAAKKAGVLPGASTDAPLTGACHNPLFEQDVNARENPFYDSSPGEAGFVPLMESS